MTSRKGNTAMTVRAKFFCSEITKTGWSQEGVPIVGGAVTFKFKAVYSNKPDHENKAFWDATPSADLSMIITNPAGQIFELGQEYYLDFTPA
mgnify:CR=1 FL=1